MLRLSGQQKIKGFTLIGVLMIIVVIAVISVYALSITNSEEKSRNVNRTILEIKHWQEAGLSYLSRVGQWPSGNPTPVAVLQTDGYMPLGAECSPWQSGISTQSCGDFALYQVTSSATASYFTVSVQVPTTGVAQQIAAQVPMAAVNNVGGVITVNSSVPKPAYRRGWIAAAGIIGPLAQIFLPLCPMGFEGHYIMSPQYFVTGNAQNPGLNLSSSPYTATQLGYGAVANGIVTLAATRHVSIDFAYNSSYFITFCLPAGTWWMNSKTVVVPTQFVDINKDAVSANDLSQVQQCSSDWLNYNHNQTTGCPWMH